MSMDFTELATIVDELRETCRAVVAGLVEDGFTEREAHVICAGVFAPKSTDDEEEQS